MLVIPAIDLIKGKCVRLLQGRKHDKIVYSDKPADVAIKWEEQGARYIHLVDLDGAFDGSSKNLMAVKDILSVIGIPVQLGGGIRSVKDINAIIKLGVSRVIIGTVVIEKPSVAKTALEVFGPDKIVVGVDARNGKVAVRGWTKESEFSPVDIGLKMKEIGVRRFVYTDISRDGMLTGPNLPALRKFTEEVGAGVIASGGISNIEDIRAIAGLANIGVEGMITGKALYEEKINLKLAVKEADKISEKRL